MAIRTVFDTVLKINVAIKYLQRRAILRYLRFMRLLVSTPIVRDVTDPKAGDRTGSLGFNQKD